jgi:hypothetical protein
VNTRLETIGGSYRRNCPLSVSVRVRRCPSVFREIRVSRFLRFLHPFRVPLRPSVLSALNSSPLSVSVRVHLWLVKIREIRVSHPRPASPS